MTISVKLYRDILSQDSSNIEAIACIGMHHFYTDQPEVALRFYRSQQEPKKFNGKNGNM